MVVARDDLKMLNAVLCEWFQRFELHREPSGNSRIVPVLPTAAVMRTLRDAVDLINEAQERARRGERAALSMGISRVTAVPDDRLQITCDVPEALVGDGTPINPRSVS
jgi:hypothetical protein